MARVVGVGLSYGATVLLSRSLGAEQFGIYSLALSWALVLVFLARAGLDNAALKFVSIYLDERRVTAVGGFVRFSLVTIFSLSVLIGLVIYLLTELGLTSLTPSVVLPTALLIFPLAALGLNASLLRTAHRIFAAQFYDQLVRPAVLIVLLVAVLWSGAKLSPARAMTVTSLGAWAALVFSAVHLRRALERRGGPVDLRPWRSWLGFSVPILVLSIVQELLNQVNILMLGYLDAPAQAGLYAAAWRLSSLVTFGLVAIVSMTGPLIAAAHARGDTREVAHIGRVSARLSLLAALCLIVPLAVAGRQILLIFGPTFANAYPALLVLLLGGLANAFTGAVAYLMTMTGRHIQALAIFACALAINAALNALLIPRFSIVGAAAASTAGTIFWNFAMLAYVNRRRRSDLH